MKLDICNSRERISLPNNICISSYLKVSNSTIILVINYLLCYLYKFFNTIVRQSSTVNSVFSENLILTNLPFTLNIYGFLTLVKKSNILSSLDFLLSIFIEANSSTSSSLHHQDLHFYNALIFPDIIR